MLRKSLLLGFFLFLNVSAWGFFSSSVPVENSSGFTAKVSFDKKTDLISISPSTKSLDVSTSTTNCTVYMDSTRYVTYKINRKYFFSTPTFSLYRDANGNYVSVMNGEVSPTDEFVRFGDGINGISVKFASSSSGMPPSSDQTLKIYGADSNNTKKN